jgi:hypothetical protein
MEQTESFLQILWEYGTAVRRAKKGIAEALGDIRKKVDLLYPIIT